MDQYVGTDGRRHAVYSYGQGPVTVVLLSGSGVPFPALEYRPLAEDLAETCRVVGIEKPGYGHSDLAEGSRTADTAVREYRCVLRELRISEPVVLAAHSMGFLEALRWGQLYPSEVLGILGIDAAVPECYQDFDLEKAVEGLREMAGNEPLRRETAETLTELLLREHAVSSSEREELQMLAYRNLANRNWISEAENLREAIAAIERDGPYLQIPMLFFISNGEGTTLDQETWRHHSLRYLRGIRTAQYALYDYPHNLYRFAHRQMAEEARDFISKYIGAEPAADGGGCL